MNKDGHTENNRCRDYAINVFKYLEKKELFRLSWGATNTHGDAWTKLEKEFEERLA